MSTAAELPVPGREIHHAEALAWLAARGPQPGLAVVTSLPDVSEVRLPLPDWRTWFLRAVTACVDAVEPAGVAVFFQSDIKREGSWIDKGALVVRAAEDAGARVLFHKIICRRPPGLPTFGRPGFTHLIAVSRTFRCPDELPIPDVIVDPGRAPWVRAMGIRAAAHAVRFVRDQAQAQVVLDPFCGVGTIPAVANALGLSAIGVELSRKRAEQARELQIHAAELT